MQERHNSSALAMESHLSCTNPWIYYTEFQRFFHSWTERLHNFFLAKCSLETSKINLNYNNETFFLKSPNETHMTDNINSSDARDRIFHSFGKIPCLLMPWFLKSSENQQAWYWQYKIGNMNGCSIENLVFFYWTRYDTKCEYPL